MDAARSPLVLSALDASDADAVLRIYADGIATGNATFETAPPTWSSFDAGRLPACRIAARRAGSLVGWAALSAVSSRCVYAGVAEVSVYVARAEWGRGTGGALLSALISASEDAGIWTLEAGIFPENQVSVRMHEKRGFRLVGVRERVGRDHERWRDVLLLERRSSVAGVD